MAPPAEQAPITAEALRARQRLLLQTRLGETNRALAETSTLLPTAVMALGLIATATGAIIGVARSVRCHRRPGCAGAHPAAGLLVVGGLSVTGVGFLWRYWTEDDQRELRSRRYQIRNELQWLVTE